MTEHAAKKANVDEWSTPSARPVGPRTEYGRQMLAHLDGMSAADRAELDRLGEFDRADLEAEAGDKTGT